MMWEEERKVGESWVRDCGGVSTDAFESRSSGSDSPWGLNSTEH